MSFHRVSKDKLWYDTCFQILLVTRKYLVVPKLFDLHEKCPFDNIFCRKSVCP